jgi:mannosyltransferase OCH1-like enzyme
MIPKIIHQMGPTDKTKWDYLWFSCQESWKKHFSDFEYMFWNDKENIDSFVQENYSEYYEAYNSCTTHILRIDFSRYLILHHYGGIYADLDMFCYKNFYDKLNDNKEAYLIESLFNKEELVQNSLMVFEKNSIFIKQCIDLVASRIQKTKQKVVFDPQHSFNATLIKYIAGPYLLSDSFMMYEKKQNIGILNKRQFNPHHFTYHEDYITKHMMTGRWGDDQREFLINSLKKYERETNKSMNIEEFMQKSYEKHRYFLNKKIDVKTFDFYKNYI